MLLAIAFLLLGLSAVAVLTVRARNRSRQSYRHDHCKFDRNEVNRTRLLPTPPIDVSNLPPADPAVAALLASVDHNRVHLLLNQVTGETNVTVGGKSVRIASRNSFHGDLEHAYLLAEEFYRSMGFKPRKEAKPGERWFERHAYTVGRRTLYNIIAEIPGRMNPKKVLVVGSHLDSTAGWPSRTESVAPGADDDASGTVAVFELGRALVRTTPGFTIRFCHFTGEEQGLLGSEAYAAQVYKEGTDVVGMIQMDMVGYCGRPGNRVDVHDDVDRNGSHSIVVSMVQNAKRYNLDLNVVDTHNHAVSGRSDHGPFLDKRWKAVLVSEEFTDEGFNPNYHTRGDRVSTLNLPWMVNVIRMVLASVIELGSVRV
jgi:hypothetical protein